MTRVAIDALTREQLLDLREPLEIVDESGNVLGRYLPIFDPMEYEPSEPQISEEEIRRRREEKGTTYGTDEVIQRLENA